MDRDSQKAAEAAWRVFVSSQRTPGKPNTKHMPRTDWSIGVITILYIYYLQRVENASPYKWLEAGISVLQV